MTEFRTKETKKKKKVVYPLDKAGKSYRQEPDTTKTKIPYKSRRKEIKRRFKGKDFYRVGAGLTKEQAQKTAKEERATGRNLARVKNFTGKKDTYEVWFSPDKKKKSVTVDVTDTVAKIKKREAEEEAKDKKSIYDGTETELLSKIEKADRRRESIKKDEVVIKSVYPMGAGIYNVRYEDSDGEHDFRTKAKSKEEAKKDLKSHLESPGEPDYRRTAEKYPARIPKQPNSYTINGKKYTRYKTNYSSIDDALDKAKELKKGNYTRVKEIPIDSKQSYYIVLYRTR